jgi:trk system potassium uptake protein TrkH
MNYRQIIRLLGLLLLVLAGCMAAALAVEMLGVLGHSSAERMAAYALTWAAAITATIGGLAWYLGRDEKQDHLNRRDALLLVSLGWLIGGALSALPYYAWAKLGGPIAMPDTPAHPFNSFIACYFEAMSGLSTTGATVLNTAPNDIESVPKGLLLWRAFTHWLGGLGIVVLFVAVLPIVGLGGKKLFHAESAGPRSPGVKPRIRDTARTLWLIYLTLTVVLALLYALAGMTWFDAVCHTFATLATGGFSTKNASMGAYYDMPLIDWITILFMLLAGVNFGLYYMIANGRWRDVLQDRELRLYLIIIASASAIIAAYIFHHTIVITDGTERQAGFVEAIRGSLFQVIAIMTTTGYATIDFDQWAFFPKAILLGLMFVGGCAGSTGGGIKVIRILIAAKVILAEFEKIFRPNVVKPIHVGRGTVDADAARSVLIYILSVVVIFYLGAVGLMILEPTGSLSFTSAATASIATLMNIGPGLQAVGAVQNYGFFTPASMLLMTLLMALGRLEIFVVLVLLNPRFWHDR